MTRARLTDADVTRLEQWIDAADAELPPLRRFIVPGGAPAAATLHLARTVCRRAERHIVGLGADAVDPLVIVYVNRLSDLLFVLARLANARAGVADRECHRPSPRPARSGGSGRACPEAARHRRCRDGSCRRPRAAIRARQDRAAQRRPR